MKVKMLRAELEKAQLLSIKLEDCVAFFSRDVLGHRSYIAAFLGEEIVGLVCFVEESRYAPNSFGVSFISTHVGHRRKGVAKALVEALFNLAEQEGKGIVNTPYEPDGDKWLRPLMTAATSRFPNIRLLERD